MSDPNLQINDKNIQSNNFFKFICHTLKSLKDPLRILDKDLNVLYSNHNNFSEFVSNEIIEHPQNCFSFFNNRSKCDGCVVELAFKTKNHKSALQFSEKENAWYRIHAYPVLDSEQEVQQVLEVISDANSEILNTENLRNSENKFRHLFENESILVIYFDPNLVIQNLNKQAALLFKNNPEQIIGKHLCEIFPSKSGKALQRKLQEVIKNKAKSEIQCQNFFSQNFEWFYSLLIPIFSNDGSVSGIQMVSHNITLYKNTEFQIAKKLKFEEAITKISNLFASENNVESSIEDALAIIGDVTGADRAYLYKFNEDLTLMSNTYEWCNIGIKPQIDSFQEIETEFFPWWIIQLQGNNHIVVDDVNNLPDSLPEKGMLQSQDIKSLAVYSIVVNNKLFGYIGIDFVNKISDWKNDECSLVQLTAQIYSRATERFDYIQSLHESDEKIHSIIDRTLVGIVILNQDFEINFANRRFAELTGFEANEIINKKITEFLPKKEATRFLEYYQQRLNHDNVSNYIELDYLDKAKNLNNSEISVSVYKDKNQKTNVIAQIIDITERTKSQKKVNLLSKSLEAAPISVIITDANGDIEYVNPMFTEITGYSSEEIIGKNPKFIQSGQYSADFYKELYNQLLSTGFWRGELPNKRKNGELFWEYSAFATVKDEYGNLTQIVALKIDITKEKEYINKLKSSEEWFRNLIENCSDIVLALNPSLKIIYCCPSGIRVFGDCFEQTQKSFVDLIEKSDQVAFLTKVIELLQNPSSIPKLEIHLQNQNNEYFIAEIKLSNFFDQSSSQVIILNIRDITEENRIKEEILLVKDNAERADKFKSLFLANMSHEIRTPMNSIIGFSYLLDDASLSETEKDLYIKIIQNNAQSLLELINDILDLSKIEAGQLEIRIKECSVNSLMDNLLNQYKLDKNLPHIDKVKIHLKKGSENDFILKTDPSKLEQIFKNLLTNAFKFTKEGKIEFGYEIKANDVEFFVSDTGMGIPEEFQESIFEQYLQLGSTQNNAIPGIGLGLAITKKLVHLLNGNIWLESKLGSGTKFIFSIPFEGNHVIEKPIPVAKPSNPIDILKNKRILVVEDEPSNFLFIKTILKRYGIEVLWAKNAIETMDMKPSNINIDAILMDINLGMMNGYELTRELRNLGITIPIIAQTAYALTEDREKALDAGCNDYLTKPINKETLINALVKVF